MYSSPQGAVQDNSYKLKAEKLLRILIIPHFEQK